MADPNWNDIQLETPYADFITEFDARTKYKGGWLPAGETWTPLSTMDVAVGYDATLRYPVGPLVKLFQSGVWKYFYLTDVSATTLTLIPAADWTLSAVDPITFPQIALIENPLGWPEGFRGQSRPHFQGWFCPGETFTYASATSMTAAGASTRYQVGDRAWLYNGSAYKYFYIIAVIGDTIHVAGPSTLTAGAITQVYVSRLHRPWAFPAPFIYVPTVVGFLNNPASAIYDYRVDGKWCTVHVSQPNDGTSNSASFTISAPITAVTAAGEAWYTLCGVVDNGSAQVNPGRAFIASGGSAIIVQKALDGSGFTTSGGKRVLGFDLQYRIAG